MDALIAEISGQESQVKAAEGPSSRRRPTPRTRRSGRRRRELASQIANVPSESGFLWPLPGRYSLSLLYGSQEAPVTGKANNHTGIDVPAPSGTPIQACKSGVVTTSTYNNSYGNYVVVSHSDGTSTPVCPHEPPQCLQGTDCFSGTGHRLCGDHGLLHRQPPPPGDPGERKPPGIPSTTSRACPSPSPGCGSSEQNDRGGGRPAGGRSCNVPASDRQIKCGYRRGSRHILPEEGEKMLGELVYCSDRDGKLRRQERYGLTVLRAEVRPGGWGEGRGWKRTARRLARLGVRRVLVPEGSCRWELLSLWGLEPVDPAPFLRACDAGWPWPPSAGERDHAPAGERWLSGGGWVDRTWSGRQSSCVPGCGMWLSPHRWGGGELAAWLRREFGAPIRPDRGDIPAAVCFDGTGTLDGRRVLSLFGPEPGLAGIRLRASAWSRRTGKSSL